MRAIFANCIDRFFPASVARDISYLNVKVKTKTIFLYLKKFEVNAESTMSANHHKICIMSYFRNHHGNCSIGTRRPAYGYFVTVQHEPHGNVKGSQNFKRNVLQLLRKRKSIRRY